MTSIQGIRPAALAAALLVASAASHAALTYTFTPLDSFGGSIAVGNAVNGIGTVVGYATQPRDNQDSPLEPIRPARWTSAAPTDIGVVNDGLCAFAYGINDAGQMVGTSCWPDNSRVHATLWINGSIVDLGTLGGNSEASAINKAGVIVGYSVPSDYQARAVVWKKGHMKVLRDLGGPYARANAISDNGLIAGYSSDPTDTGFAVIWQDGALTKLGPGEAYGVNRNGVAVGISNLDAHYHLHAMKWVGAATTELGTLGGDQSLAYGINDAGDIVGASSLEGCCAYHATLWHKGKPLDLNNLVDASVREAGWVLTRAKAIDRAGHITGTADNTLLGLSRAFLLTPIL